MRFLCLFLLSLLLVVRGDPSSVAFVDSAKQFISQLPSQLSSVDLADVAGRVLGIGSVNQKNLDFVSNDLFHRARANVHISVVGLEKESTANLPSLNKIFSSASSVSTGFSPADEVSLMTSVASGQLPSQHGVVGRKWNRAGEEQTAFLTPGAGSLSLSLADRLALAFQGEPLIVSASLDSQLALSTCVSEELNALHPSWNYFCLSSSDLLNSDRSLFTQSQQSPASLVASLLPSEQSILSSFDLSSKETTDFFAELALFDSLLTSLNNKEFQAMVNDNVPDLFYFHFSTIKNLAKQYGVSSQQYLAALRLVDAAVSRLINQLQSLYNQQALVEVLLLNPSVPSAVPVATAQRDPLLSKITLLAENVNNNGTTNPTARDIETYQIVLWLSIGLALVLFAAVHTLAFMHFKKDTLIFGNFNPNWEDRKRS